MFSKNLLISIGLMAFDYLCNVYSKIKFYYRGLKFNMSSSTTYACFYGGHNVTNAVQTYLSLTEIPTCTELLKMLSWVNEPKILTLVFLEGQTFDIIDIDLKNREYFINEHRFVINFGTIDIDTIRNSVLEFKSEKETNNSASSDSDFIDELENLEKLMSN